LKDIITVLLGKPGCFGTGWHLLLLVADVAVANISNEQPGSSCEQSLLERCLTFVVLPLSPIILLIHQVRHILVVKEEVRRTDKPREGTGHLRAL